MRAPQDVSAPCPSVPSDLIPATAAAQHLDCCVATIYRWVQSGRLPAWRRGRGAGRLFVSRADLDAMFQPANPATVVRTSKEAARGARDLLDAAGI